MAATKLKLIYPCCYDHEDFVNMVLRIYSFRQYCMVEAKYYKQVLVVTGNKWHHIW